MVRIKCTDDAKEQQARLKVIGVGGAGGNAINRMVEAGVRGVELIAANTDAQVLRSNKAGQRIQLGEALTRGLGAGGSPARGRQAAEESRQILKEAVSSSDLVFITAGMGGGTGTGGAPVVAELAKEAGALTVGVVSRPFDFEGSLRAAQAAEGIKELRAHVDTLLIISNDLLFGVIEESTPAAEAFRRADDVLRQSIQSISDLITREGDINVDFADVKAILAGAGEALIGMGEKSGPRAALEAAKEAVHSPLLDSVSIDGAQRLIVTITGPKNRMILTEIREAMDFIRGVASPESNVKLGTAYDDGLGDRIRVTVVAAGLPPRRPGRARKDLKAAAPAGRASAKDAVPPARPSATTGFPPEEWMKPAFLTLKTKRLK